MLTPTTLEVLILSFEGPDQYSHSGGLGVRTTELSRALAAMGYATTLAFVGAPDAPEEEQADGVRLIRCAQAVSNRFPRGVYDGEAEKILELCSVLPDQLIDRVIRPAVQRGRMVAVLCEEWQLADVCHLLHRRLVEARMRRSCTLLWNANNHFGFGGIDWPSLERAAAITTVSRYMKQLMRPHGVNPVVIPNGIAPTALLPVDPTAAGTIASAAGSPCLAFKIGRFSPDKCWHQALAAIARLRAEGMQARLLIRGDGSRFGATVMAQAARLELQVARWEEPVTDFTGVARALAQTGSAPVVDLRRYLPSTVLPQIFAAATAVLANSNHEPFGLVGLETMAAGGVAVVGGTGEDYARPFGNAMVIETDDAAELETALATLVERPDLAVRLREAGRRDAADFAWPRVIEGLMERLRFLSVQQEATVPSGGAAAPVPA